MMKCSKCGEAFEEDQLAEAAISIFVMGDEYLYSYWACRRCGYFTVESFRDRFAGEEEITFLPPVPREMGEECVKLVRACPRPFDKYCDCDSHKALFFGVPTDFQKSES